VTLYWREIWPNMFNFTTIPIRYRKQRTSLNISFSYDNFEYYSITDILGDLNGGFNWGGYFIDKNNPFGIYEYDDFEGYTDSADMGGLFGGNKGWSGSYVSRNNPLGLQSYDDFETYTDSDSLNGLNNVTSGSWDGSYVSR